VSRTILEVRDVSKRYPGTLALDRVSFGLSGGVVSALIGENGAGKSTLVKILGGIEQPTEGALLLDGKPIHLRSVRDADACGIGMIHQELNLCPNLTVAENIFLAREIAPRGLLDSRRQCQKARELLQRMEHPIDVDALAGDLPLGQQQIVEIAKALARDVRVLMMDEPTSALSAPEIAVLFRIIRDLKSRGVAVLYISHRLEELLEIADTVSVLRDGRLVGEAQARDVGVAWIVERMTGRSAKAVEAADAHEGRELLRVEGCSLVSPSGTYTVRNVNLTVRAGEVLGIYGLMGAGRTELLECLMGLHTESASGRVWLNGRLQSGGPATRIASGLAMAPEDRQAAGLVPTMSVRENVSLASLRKVARWTVLSQSKETTEVAQLVDRLRIKLPGLEANIAALSGGNQQKVVIARCLMTTPKVLLLDEPARGVDVGAKREIYGIVRQLAAAGMGIVFVSSELEEVRAIATRVIVMSRGAITAEFGRAQADDHALAVAASAHPDGANGERHGVD
jgi:erythritol transport system ATP-binding protein